MARRTVRSLTPRIAAASLADTGHVSGAPDTWRFAALSNVRSSMTAAASATTAESARAFQATRRAGDDPQPVSTIGRLVCYEGGVAAEGVPAGPDSSA